MQPAYSRLHSELWGRQWQALQRCKPTAMAAAASQRQAAEQQLDDLDQKPAEVAGCALYPHQLQVRGSFTQKARVHAATGHSWGCCACCVSSLAACQWGPHTAFAACCRGLQAAEHLRAQLAQLIASKHKSIHAHVSCCVSPHSPWPGLQGVNWMRKCWASSQPMLLADEMGLGKTASVICFVQCLRCSTQRCHRPVSQSVRLFVLKQVACSSRLWGRSQQPMGCFRHLHAALHTVT